MALRIFETDPEAGPRTGGDIVGRFRSGQQVNGRPMALQEWRITTSDPDVADRVAELFGGTPEEWETESGEDLEVLTDAKEVKILLEAPNAISTKMVLWGRNALLRACDGVTQLGTNDEDEDKGAPCVCPPTFKGRKEAAKAGKGCEPSIAVYFTLADDPELGKFKFFSGSWSLARDIPAVEDKLLTMEGIVPARMGLEVVEMNNGNKFTKPYVKLG